MDPSRIKSQLFQFQSTQLGDSVDEFRVRYVQQKLTVLIQKLFGIVPSTNSPKYQEPEFRVGSRWGRLSSCHDIVLSCA